MSYRSHLILIVGAILLSLSVALGAPNVHFGAVPGWVTQVTPNTTRPNLRDVNDGWFFQLVDQQIYVAGEQTYRRLIRDIYSDAGVQGASNISVNFNPAYEQLIFHQVTVWRDGHPMDRMKKDAFKVIANEHDLSMFIYNGNYSAYLIVDDVRAGDKIEYSYTITGSNPIFNKKFCTSLTMQATDPLSHLHYVILMPTSRPISLKYFNEATKPVITNAGSNVRYEWDLKNVKGKQYNNNVPGWLDLMPNVQLSEYNGWNEVVEWAYNINKPVDKLEGTLGKRIAKLKAESGDDSEKLFRQLVDIVQNEVRYMGVETGIYSHQANRPEKVYEQRYGDCKDKSLLLVSMLRTAGFNAYVALANTNDKNQIQYWLPSANSFNHAIVQALFDGKEVWIDATISYQGGKGANIYIPNYGKALVLATGNNTLSTLPNMRDGEIVYSETYEMVDEKKPVTLLVYTTYTANSADDIRQSYANQSKADLEKNFLDYYSKTYQNIQSTDSLEIQDDKERNSLETTEHYAIDNFFEHDSATGAYSASFYAGTIRDMLPQPGNNRTQPLALPYPYNLRYNIQMNSTITWNIPSSSQHIRRDAYEFSYDISVADGTLMIAYKFTILKDHIAASEIAQYERDRKKIVNDYLSYSFTYTPGGATTASGINWMAVFVFISLLAGLTYAGIRIYRTRTERMIFGPRHTMALGGWVILPMIGLFISSLYLPYQIINSHYLNNRMWHVYDGQPNELALKALLWMELIGNTICFSMAVFCLVLMFNKRDILPRWIKSYYVVYFTLILADNTLASLIMPATMKFDFREVFRGLVAMAIWVPYFNQADRVRDTFIVPYPEQQDYNNPYKPAPVYDEDVAEV